MSFYELPTVYEHFWGNYTSYRAVFRWQLQCQCHSSIQDNNCWVINLRIAERIFAFRLASRMWHIIHGQFLGIHAWDIHNVKGRNCHWHYCIHSVISESNGSNAIYSRNWVIFEKMIKFGIRKRHLDKVNYPNTKLNYLDWSLAVSQTVNALSSKLIQCGMEFFINNFREQVFLAKRIKLIIYVNRHYNCNHCIWFGRILIYVHVTFHPASAIDSIAHCCRMDG